MEINVLLFMMHLDMFVTITREKQICNWLLSGGLQNMLCIRPVIHTERQQQKRVFGSLHEHNSYSNLTVTENLRKGS